MSWPRSNQDLSLGLLYFLTFQFSSCLFYLLGACQKQEWAKQLGFRSQKPTLVPAQEVTGALRGGVPELDFAGEGVHFLRDFQVMTPRVQESPMPTGTMGRLMDVGTRQLGLEAEL